MKIAIGADHAGYKFKEAIKGIIEAKGHNVLDMGPMDEQSCDYPDFAAKVAHVVADGQVDRGVLICGTGIGMSMAANKVKGIRAALCTNTYMAKMSRAHNDANIIALGERVIGLGLASDILDAFLNTDFEGDRHARRVGKIMALD